MFIAGQFFRDFDALENIENGLNITLHSSRRLKVLLI